jgi:hypothetical protein
MMKLFISHASEDKEAFVRPLAEALRDRRLELWYDEYVLQPGDSLRESVEKGLANCDYGVVVLSEAFFSKSWPQQELNGLFARAVASERRFLIPILHGIGIDRVREVAPMLSDRVALFSSIGVTKVARHILALLVGDEERRRWDGGGVVRHQYAHRYYRPPEVIPKLGYELRAAGFSEMMGQLRPREVIIAFSRASASHDCAAHVTDEERMLEIEKDWLFPPHYYAVDVRKLLGGFNIRLPENELRQLLDSRNEAPQQQ